MVTLLELKKQGFLDRIEKCCIILAIHLTSYLLIYDFLGFCCCRGQLQSVLHELQPNKEAATPAGCGAIWFSHLWHILYPFACFLEMCFLILAQKVIFLKHVLDHDNVHQMNKYSCMTRCVTYISVLDHCTKYILSHPVHVCVCLPDITNQWMLLFLLF